MTLTEEQVCGAAGQPGGDRSGEPMVLTVELTGDRVAAENVILEVRALAQKFGLEIPDFALIRQPAIVAKKVIPASDPVPDAEFDGSVPG
jgi:hypothetical protein